MKNKDYIRAELTMKGFTAEEIDEMLWGQYDHTETEDIKGCLMTIFWLGILVLVCIAAFIIKSVI